MVLLFLRSRIYLLLAMLVVPFGVIWAWHRSGEGMSQGELLAVHQQLPPHSLIGLQSKELGGFFKLHATIERKPKAIIIGTSRALNLRGTLFKPEAQFYNAGYGILNFTDAKLFLHKLFELHKPDIVLYSLDAWNFNSNCKDYNESVRWRSEYPETFASEGGSLIPATRGQYRDLLNALAQHNSHFWSMSSLGLTGILKEAGFRNVDGSYKYPLSAHWSNKSSADHQFSEGIRRFTERIDRFVSGDQVSTVALQELQAVLAECRAQKVEMIGFIPPFATVLHERLLHSPQHGYYAQFAGAAKEVFDKNSYSLSDFSDLKAMGSDDNEMIDYMHPGDKLYARMLKALAGSSSRLTQYVDLAAVNGVIETSGSQNAILPE